MCVCERLREQRFKLRESFLQLYISEKMCVCISVVLSLTHIQFVVVVVALLYAFFLCVMNVYVHTYVCTFVVL